MQIELKRRSLPEAILKLIGDRESGKIASEIIFFDMLKAMIAIYQEIEEKAEPHWLDKPNSEGYWLFWKGDIPILLELKESKEHYPIVPDGYIFWYNSRFYTTNEIQWQGKWIKINPPESEVEK